MCYRSFNVSHPVLNVFFFPTFVICCMNMMLLCLFESCPFEWELLNVQYVHRIGGWCCCTFEIEQINFFVAHFCSLSSCHHISIESSVISTEMIDIRRCFDLYLNKCCVVWPSHMNIWCTSQYVCSSELHSRDVNVDALSQFYVQMCIQFDGIHK